MKFQVVEALSRLIAPIFSSPPTGRQTGEIWYESTSNDFKGQKTGGPVSLGGIGVEYDAGNSSTSKTIDWANGENQKVTMTGNCTFTFSNPVACKFYTLKLIQDGTGSRTATFPATVKKQSTLNLTLTTTASKTDLLSCYYDGTNYLANLGKQYE